MTHIEDGILRAYLDEELDPERERGAATHLATCHACATRLAYVQRMGAIVGRRLAMLDAPAPVRAAWPRVKRRLADEGRRGRSAPIARAAGLVLLLGGGAAAALLPGSPLRRADVADAPAAPSGLTAEAPAQAGVRPQSGRDRVRFVVEAPAGTEVVVELVPETSGIFAHPGSSFSSAGEEIRAVVSEGPIRVEMSTRLVDARLEINGRDVLGVRNGRVVHAPADAERSSGPTRVRFRVP
jgi:hypothetical protein